MNNDFRKKLCLLLSSYIVIFNCFLSLWNNNRNNRVVYNPTYEYSSADEFAYFKGGRIYICSSEVIEEIRDDSTSDIYIIDQRDGRDPNIRICNSYEITNPFDMHKIIDVLIEYERQFPSPWNRTAISMRREWIAHNVGYYLDVETHRTAEVDLNNEDEEKYLTLSKK